MRKFFVPGRIEVLGKHTDYAGGRSLLCAIERGFHVTVTPRADATVTVTDAAIEATDVLAIDPDLPAAPAHWSAYPRAVARRIARNFPRARLGADIRFHSNLPPDAGLSSSSALIISIFLALAAVNELEEHEEYAASIHSREDLATYLACIENGASFGHLAGDRGVGTAGGSEDHTAILCCTCGALSMYSFAPARLERTVPMPAGCVFAVGASGVRAQKTGAAMRRYNAAAAQAAALLQRWNLLSSRSDRTLGSALSASPDAYVRLRSALEGGRDRTLLTRLEQFEEESTRLVPAAADALAAGDLDAFGTLVGRSQQLAEGTLGNQVPETIALARLARATGALAASAFGAGFGGSVWALIPHADAADFIERWAAQYRHEFPGRAADARFFLTGAGAAATEV